MKQISAVILALIAFCVVSCTSKDGAVLDKEAAKMVETQVAAANAQCPIEFGLGNDVVLESVTYDDNMVVYHYTLARIEEDAISELDNLKMGLIYNLKADKSSEAFIENVIKAGAGLDYSYMAPSGKSFSVIISNEELKEAFE